MAREIAQHLRRPGVDTLVDVFGGSGAVTINSGFAKRVWNDASGDLATLFRVLADSEKRPMLLRRLKAMPPSRRLFDQLRAKYLAGALSFVGLPTDVERAAAVFYLHQFSFGGKGRSGGFSVTTKDGHGVMEVVRYRNALRRLGLIGSLFRSTVIENLDFRDIVRIYGGKTNVVLFADPPYVGTEKYYSVGFSDFDHVSLATSLASARCHVVLTYYESELIRHLYPPPAWNWTSVMSTKNSRFRGGQKAKVNEWIIAKR
jgi:DNA adenine methylase